MKLLSDLAPRDDLVLIGRVLGAHGIKGVVRVYSYAQSPECFAPGNELIIICGDNRSVSFAIKAVQPYKNVVRLTLEGIATRNAAEALSGCEVFLPKVKLPPLAEDTFYWIDLIGLSVFDMEGVLLGKIEEIIPTGANDVYVVRPQAGGDSREILIPAIASVVLEVDLQHGLMRVELPDGLLP